MTGNVYVTIALQMTPMRELSNSNAREAGTAIHAHSGKRKRERSTPIRRTQVSGTIGNRTGSRVFEDSVYFTIALKNIECDRVKGGWTMIPVT